MSVSGNIGDTIQFQVTGANSVTGIKFGSGQANFNKISNTVLDAVVPQTATYGKVAFQKENSIETAKEGSPAVEPKIEETSKAEIKKEASAVEDKTEKKLENLQEKK